MMAEDEEVGGGGASDKPKYSVEEFLGLFDGSVDSGKPNGRLVFFTTNTPDALHHKVAALSNDLYEFCNPGKQVMKDYWQNFFQDQQKIIVEKTWNAFSANYKSVWKLGKKEDHSTYKVHHNKISKYQPKLVIDEERGKKKQSMMYGLNGQHVFCATHVFALSIEHSTDCFIPSPSDWTPGFFWKVNILFAGNVSSEEFVLCESVQTGSTTVYITHDSTSNATSNDLDTGTKDVKLFCNLDIVDIEFVEHRQHSMAMLQKYCIRFRNHPEQACMAKHVEQLGEKTPAGDTTAGTEDGDKKKKKIIVVNTPPRKSKRNNLRMQSSAVASRMKNTSIDVARRIKNNVHDGTTSETETLSPRKQARVLIDKIEKQIAEKFQDESDAFLLEKSKQTLRTKLQKLNATYDISPFSTKKINLIVTCALTSSVVLFGLLQKKFMGIPIKIWHLMSAVTFFVGPSLFELYKRKTYGEFLVACNSSVGRALVSYLDQRVKNISGYNVQAAINVNRIKGKAEEKMMDYAVSTNRGKKNNKDTLLYKIRMGSKEAALIPKFSNDWHGIETSLARSSTNDDAIQDTVTVYHQINDEISNKEEDSLTQAEHTRRQVGTHLDRGERDSSSSQDDYADRTASLGPMTLSIKRTRYLSGHIVSHLTDVLQEYADNNAIFQQTRVISYSRVHKQIEYASYGANPALGGEVWMSPDNREGRLKPQDYYWPIDYPAFQQRLQLMEHDVKTFVESRQFYLARGIPFRRGYLLSGTPGCGKMFWIYNIAAILGREVCVLDMASSQVKSMGDTGLVLAVNELGANALLVLKNIDAIPMRSTGSGKKKSLFHRNRYEEDD